MNSNRSTGNHGNGFNQIFADDDRGAASSHRSDHFHFQRTAKAAANQRIFLIFHMRHSFHMQIRTNFTSQTSTHFHSHWPIFGDFSKFFKFPGSTRRCQISAKSTDLGPKLADDSTGTTRNVTCWRRLGQHSTGTWIFAQVQQVSYTTRQGQSAARRPASFCCWPITSTWRQTNRSPTLFYFTKDFHFLTRIDFLNFVDQRSSHSFDFNRNLTFQI